MPQFRPETAPGRVLAASVRIAPLASIGAFWRRNWSSCRQGCRRCGGRRRGAGLCFGGTTGSENPYSYVLAVVRVVQGRKRFSSGCVRKPRGRSPRVGRQVCWRCLRHCPKAGRGRTLPSRRRKRWSGSLPASRRGAGGRDVIAVAVAQEVVRVLVQMVDG